MSESNHNPTVDDELLSAYVDGELTVEERAVVEARLESDPAACELVAEMRSLSGTLRALPKLVTTENVRAEVLAQFPEKSVATSPLPEYRMSTMRKLIWPALAIAAAVMLMFVQQKDNRRVREIARVEANRDKSGQDKDDRHEVGAGGGGGEVRRDVSAIESAPVVSAPATAGAPVAEELADAAKPAAPAEIDAMVAGDPAAGATAPVDGTAPAGARQLSGRLDSAISSADSEFGIVHLRLNDLRSGAKEFNRLLESNGIQLVDGPTAESETMAATNGGRNFDKSVAANTEEGQSSAANALSTRSAESVADGFGGAAGNKPIGIEPAETEPEMILVEAPPKQIESILFSCSQDTSAIKEVTVDPSANGTNLQPEKQTLSNYRQYARAAAPKGKAKGYSVTSSQQGTIAALNSIPQGQLETTTSGLYQQGWAFRVPPSEQGESPTQLGVEVNNRRNQFYGFARQQQADRKLESLAKKQPIEEPTMRVLFLLHPSEGESAKK